MLGHLSQRLDDITARLDQSGINAVKRCNEGFYRLNQLFLFNNPIHTIVTVRQRLQQLLAKSEQFTLSSLEFRKKTFTGLAARLEVLSPLATLSRGYSITTRINDGVVVSDASSLLPGEFLRHRLSKGEVITMVESVNAKAR